MIRHRRGRGAARIRRGTAGEKGVALVEFAIIVPMLAVLVFGALELGFQWRFAHQAVSASRSAARVGAGLGTNSLTDYQILTTVRASLESNGQFGQLDRVVIFRSTTGEPPAQCLQATPSGVCNVFVPSVFGSLSTGQFHATTGCYTGVTSNAPRRGWCPSSRVIDQRNADYLGVAIVLKSDSITGLYPQYKAMRTTVMRMEPTT